MRENLRESESDKPKEVLTPFAKRALELSADDDSISVLVFPTLVHKPDFSGSILTHEEKMRRQKVAAEKNLAGFTEYIGLVLGEAFEAPIIVDTYWRNGGEARLTAPARLIRNLATQVRGIDVIDIPRLKKS